MQNLVYQAGLAQAFGFAIQRAHASIVPAITRLNIIINFEKQVPIIHLFPNKVIFKGFKMVTSLRTYRQYIITQCKDQSCMFRGR